MVLGLAAAIGVKEQWNKSRRKCKQVGSRKRESLLPFPVLQDFYPLLAEPNSFQECGWQTPSPSTTRQIRGVVWSQTSRYTYLEAPVSSYLNRCSTLSEQIDSSLQINLL